MNVAAYLLLYTASLMWLGPRLLARLTRGAFTPQLGVAAWLTAIIGVLAAWVAALAVLIIDAGHNVSHGSALAFCSDTLGFIEHLGLSRYLATIAVMVLIGVGLLVTARVATRTIGAIRRLRFHSHQHAAAARVVGLPTDRPGVVVVSAAEPGAYCVAGRPGVIVVTTAALDRLDESQLAAVLAHERAHLTGRHHDLLTLLRALAASLPRIPLFGVGAEAVSHLLEMCADDTAARRHGPDPLLSGLIALARRPALPGVLGAADTAVVARATRLVRPARRRVQWRARLTLSAAIAVTTAIPVFAGLACLA